MRHLANALLLVLLTVCPSLAQGNGNGAGNGSENGQGNNAGNNGNGNAGNGNAGNSGNANSNGNGNAGDNGNGNGNAGNNGNGDGDAGNSGNTGNGVSQGSGSSDNSATTDADGTLHFTQDYARDAASAGKIVGLSSLMPGLQERTPGQVIDAELLQVRGFLVYSIRVLRADGKVTTEFYYAQSGRYIGSQS